MTRRERIEKRLEDRRSWAASRAIRSEAETSRAIGMLDCIPMGQPILVGHHSERRHRNLLDKSDNAMRRAVESDNMAKHHAAVANTLEGRLDTCIFSDDTDAIEQLKLRIADREAQSDRMKMVNKSHKAFLKTGKIDPALSPEEAETVRHYKPPYSWMPHPFPLYSLSNLRGRIQTDKKRLALIESQGIRKEKAQSAGGVVVEGGDYVRVTFAEKPSRDILNALRSSGFRWGGGSWCGNRSSLPEIVTAHAG